MDAIILMVICIALLYYFFGTEIGCAVRATGSNQNMARSLGVKTNFTIILGLMISNGLVALSGSLIAQLENAVHKQFMNPEIFELFISTDRADRLLDYLENGVSSPTEARIFKNLK